MNGFTEALDDEVEPFGIKVTVVEHGYFRTNVLFKGSLVTPKDIICTYQNVRDSQNMHQNSLDQQQAGDPEKAAAAIIKTAVQPDAPLNLFLGADAYQLAHQKTTSVQNDLETWKELTTSTGF